MKATLKDNLGREWEIDVTTSAIFRIRDATGVNLGDRRTLKENWQRLSSDAVFVVDATAAVLQPAIEKRKLTRDEFADGFQGDAIEACANAIKCGLATFMPDADLRGVMLSLIAGTAEATAIAESPAAAPAQEKLA